MSQPQEHSLPNGGPTPQYQFNGVHSAHSSRGPSPHLGPIPASQLPPGRPSIPQSQLPPSRSPIGGVTQRMGQLNVNHHTPNVSPKFSTSTPNQPGQNSAFSPVLSNTVPMNRTDTNSANAVQNSAPKAFNQFALAHTQQQQNQPPIQNQQTLQNQQQQLQSQQFQNQPNLLQQSQQLQKQPQQFQNQPQPVQQTQQQPQQFPNQQQPLLQPQQRPQTNLYSQQPVQTTTSTQNAYSSQQAYGQNVPNIPAQNSYANYAQSQQIQQFANNAQGPPQNAYSNNGPPKLPPTISNYNLNNNQAGPPQQRAYPAMPPQMNNQAQAQLPSQIPPQLAPQMPPQTTYNSIPPQPPKTVFNNRYPQTQPPINPINNQQPYQQQQPANYAFNQPQQQPKPYDGVVQTGFSKFWGQENIDLLQQPNILPPVKIDPPKVNLTQETLNNANCSPEIIRCTLTKIPENNSLLQKSRLPLGVLIHPFKDLSNLPLIQCNVIVRCRTCRTYINPFVYFVDSKRWKCNLCYRINELPEEFLYDPVSKTYGDPSRRPEIKSSTIEYIAPAEYMLRPPQPAVYLFLLDVSRLAVESGYLHTVCNILLDELKTLPGDARTQIGFITYDSALHFYSLAEGLSQPHEMTVLDIDDVFLPCPDNLLVNLKGCMDLVTDLLGQLPTRYLNSFDTNSALGAALQAAYKMMGPTGGRVTVFQAALPNIGPGALVSREDPSQRTNVEVAHLNPANDFYKRLALECSGQQIAVDLFVVNSQYVDIATISGISRFSGGCIHHFPLFKASKTVQSEALEKCLRRYLNRKIGFEAVMRIRCTRGLAIHTFHGNFFVRSTDLLTLPNVNPDAGFGMQVSIEESLSDVQTICFQAALLYTSSKGERRIRVHTLCLPITGTLQDVIHSADQQCIVGLLSKMAVDRSMQSSLSDAREAFINVAIDILSSYKFSLNMGNGQSGLLAPQCLKLLPLYINALLKHSAFRTGTNTRLDDRVKAMLDMKSKPLCTLIQQIYPDLYPVHNLENEAVDQEQVPLPPKLQLTARSLDTSGAFLMDTGEHMMLFVCSNISRQFLTEVLGVQDYKSITDEMCEIPDLKNAHNQRLQAFVSHLNDDKPYAATLQVIGDKSPLRGLFLERLIEDRFENALSYHEFLQHLKAQVK